MPGQGKKRRIRRLNVYIFVDCVCVLVATKCKGKKRIILQLLIGGGKTDISNRCIHAICPQLYK